MNTQQIEQLIEQMSTEELQAILDTQYPEELEKQAEAQIASEELAEVLYAYGAVMADREFAGADGELSKEAAAQMDEAEQEIEGLVNSYVEALGLAHIDSRVELQKEAQAAAGIILEGYMGQLEKIAVAMQGKHGGKRDMLSAGGAAWEKVKGAVKKHPKTAVGIGAAGLAGVGGLMALRKKKNKEEEMGKTASAASVDDVAEEVFDRMAELETINDGIEKIAGKGMERAKDLAKKVLKHPATAGAAGLAGGAAAMRAYMKHKEKKED